MKFPLPFVLLPLLIAGSLSLAEESPLMSAEESEECILLKRGDKVILQYNKKPTAEAAKHEPYFSRSGYIHPIYSPSGKEISGDYALDHKHQHGLFFAWTKTEYAGKAVEFWNQKLEKGKVSYLRTLKSSEGEAQCSFTVEQLWEGVSKDKGTAEILKETWEVVARDAGDDRFVFDIESVQRLVGEEPLTILKYHYGGMAIRGNAAWLAPSKEATPPGSLTTNEGLNRIDGNHTRPFWVVMEGPLDGDHAGIAVLSDPRNFRFPQWVRLHPTKPYFVFAPMVEEPFQITSEKPYVSRYRYVVFDGKADSEKIGKEWEKLKASQSKAER